MRLKKITIFGFKSFADKITLDFNAPVIAIVGPNGCGKSNIVDAFRWVMGEQSAKSLRGDKMHDVIFAGTDRRKPLNIAEVTLVFSNEQRQIPLEFDEVSITRRLFRNGESEYLINRNQARLKDIYGLFWDSGLGKDAFSIFEQGKLDQVINLNPQDRRRIFDETAGIERFLQRKKEALKKLEQVNENLLRVKDVHSEVFKQTKILEKQASIAQKFKFNQEELKELEKSYLYINWLSLSNKIKEQKNSHNNFEAKYKEICLSIQFLEERKSENRKKLKQCENTEQKIREETMRIQTEIKLKNIEYERTKNRLKEDLNKKDKILKETQSIESEKAKEQTQFANYEEKLKVANQEIKTVTEELASLKKLQKEQENDLQKLRADQQRSQKEYFEIRESVQKMQHQTKEAEIYLENLSSKQKKIVEIKDRAKEKIVHLQNEAQLRKQQVKNLSVLIDKQKVELSQFEKNIRDLELAIKEEQLKLENINKEISEHTARLKSLIRLKEEMEGFSKGAKSLLQESKNSKSSLFGKIKTFSELLQIKNSEKIISQVLKNYSQMLVVENRNAFVETLQFAQAKKLSDFSLFCLEDAEVGDSRELNHFVVKSDLTDHFLKGFHFKNQPCEFEKSIEKKTIFQEGVLIDELKVLFKSGDAHSENNALIRENEIKSIEQALQIIFKSKEEIQQLLSKQNEKIELLKIERLAIDKKLRKEEMNLIQENFGLQKSLGEIEETKKQIALQDQEEELIKKQANEKIEQIHFSKQKTEEFLILQNQKETFYKDVESQLIIQSEKQKILFRQYGEKNAHFQKSSATYQKLEQEKNIFMVRDAERLKRLSQLKKELEGFTSEHALMHEAASHLEKELSQLQMDLELQKSQFKESEEESNKIKKFSIKDDEQESVKKTEKATVESEKMRLEILLSEDLIKNQKNELEFKERFQISVEDFTLPENVESQNDLEKKIKALKQDLDRVGSVNLEAIEAFEEHKKRSDFLTVQLEDLSATQKDIQSLITKLESESRKLFKKTFEKVRENFQKNFQILFKGGEADLQFTESPDVLEAGIEIIAKPPGKQMRAISLLSGGEKCMTALALLFAIFEVKPAPFCILDEVDAPLDESNVDRFTEVLKQFIETTQFIMVTHNKKTMATANILFGVSMEEKGVSKLISLGFEKKRENHLSLEIQ